MGINDREELNGSELGGVSLSVHESLNHLNNRLFHLLDVDLTEDALDAVDGLNKNKIKL